MSGVTTIDPPGYYEGSEDYFKHSTGAGFDMHHEEGLHCGRDCTKRLWELSGQYSTNLYGARAVKLIESHPPEKPLFMYLARGGGQRLRWRPPYLLSRSVRRCGSQVLGRWRNGGRSLTNPLSPDQRRRLFHATIFAQAFQGVHSPRQAPESYVAPYNRTIKDPARRVFAGMVSAVDEGLGNVTAALKAKGMFEDTVGHTCFCPHCRAAAACCAPDP